MNAAGAWRGWTTHMKMCFDCLRALFLDEQAFQPCPIGDSWLNLWMAQRVIDAARYGQGGLQPRATPGDPPGK